MKKFVASLTMGKQQRMNGKMIPNFFQLYTLYIQNYDASFSILYLLTCLNNDTSVPLQVINIWTS